MIKSKTLNVHSFNNHRPDNIDSLKVDAEWVDAWVLSSRGMGDDDDVFICSCRNNK